MNEKKQKLFLANLCSKTHMLYESANPTTGTTRSSRNEVTACKFLLVNKFKP